MGVRQAINENKKLGIGVGGGILVLGLAVISYQLFAGSRGGSTAAKSAFYTNDNGKTFFSEDIYKVSPFDHNGKQAYRADVFQCPDGKQFVGLIYRHTSTGRTEMENYISSRLMDSDHDGAGLRGIELRSMEFKKAGADDRAWRASDEAVIESLRAAVKCPSGGPATLVDIE